MRRKLPKEYTVLIAPTGRTPITLLVKPKFTLAVILVAILTPIAALSATIHSLHKKNAALEEQNYELSETASEVITELKVLDNEIEDLRERAGMDEQTNPEANSRSSSGSRGGVSIQLETEELLAIAKSRIPELSSQLYGQVKPALNETLSEEAAEVAARPKGRPIKATAEMSSNFGLRRNPFGWGYEFHDGIDFTGPYGTPIHTTAPGIVEKAEYQGGYGYHVVIDHGYGYKTLYAHLSAMDVSTGESVSSNQIIGRLGSTGRSTGPHLHYSIYLNGESINPIQFIN